MARDSGGIMTLPLPAVATGDVIEASWANTTLSDVAAEIQDSLSRSGKGNMSAALKVIAGTVSAPGLSFASEANSGLYRAGAADVRFTLNGADHWRVTAAGLQMYVSAAWVTPLTSATPKREVLTAARTYYVRTDGSNSNTGLVNTAGGAFLTIQKAVDVCTDTLDFAGYVVTVKVADGTYTGGVAVGPMTGSGAGQFILQGNVTTPANCIISTTSANAIHLISAICNIEGFKLVTTTAGSCLVLDANSYCRVTNLMEFGACAGRHISLFVGGFIYLNTSYTISGGASHHIKSDPWGAVVAEGPTVTLTGTPAFSGAFIEMTGISSFEQYTQTFSGSATGKRYIVEANSLIQTYGSGANYFPGDVAGTAATGGQYV